MKLLGFPGWFMTSRGSRRRRLSGSELNTRFAIADGWTHPNAPRLGRIFKKRCNLKEPCGALLSSATRHRRIHTSDDAVHAAQTEDTIPPEGFEWIAERQRLALG